MKDVFTFLHDANARNDGRLLQVRAKHGLEGYGFYFCLLELMRESSDYKLRTKFADGYALQLGLEPGKFNSLLDSCVEAELITSQNGELSSASFMARMERYEQKRNTLRANALNPKRKRKAKAKHLLSESKADVYIPFPSIPLPSVEDLKEGSGEETTRIGEYFQADAERLAKLRDDFGLEKFDYYIAAFNDYVAQDPARLKKYKNHIATIRNWERRDVSELKGFHAPKRRVAPTQFQTAGERRAERSNAAVKQILAEENYDTRRDGADASSVSGLLADVRNRI